MTQKEINSLIVKLGENKLFEFKRMKGGRATYEADNGKVICSVNTQNDEFDRFESLKELTKCDDFQCNAK